MSSDRSGRDLVKRNRFGGAPRLLARVLLVSLVIAVSVLRVTLAASLFPDPVFEVGSNPVSVAVGDFNGDGRPDLAVANYGSNDVSVIATPSNTVTATIPVGIAPIGASVSPDGSKVYITNTKTS